MYQIAKNMVAKQYLLQYQFYDEGNVSDIKCALPQLEHNLFHF